MLSCVKWGGLSYRRDCDQPEKELYEFFYECLTSYCAYKDC